MTTLSIDFGQLHMAVCEYNPTNTTYNVYLYSVDSSLPLMQKMIKERQYLTKIFDTVKKPIKCVIIEQQIFKNVPIEYSYIMLLSEFALKYKFMFCEQHGYQKYIILNQIYGKHDSKNNKRLGAMCVAQCYIQNNLVKVFNIGEFGKNSSKRHNGHITKCNYYTPEVYKFCLDNDIDKLDDVADTILMIIAFNRGYLQRTKIETYEQYTGQQKVIQFPLQVEQ